MRPKNVNDRYRTLNFSHVHQSDLDELPNAQQRFDAEVGEGRRVADTVHTQDHERGKMREVHYYIALLQTARRLHRRRPHVPTHVMRQIERLKLAKPVRL